jgi:hypothetical protein
MHLKKLRKKLGLAIFETKQFWSPEGRWILPGGLFKGVRPWKPLDAAAQYFRMVPIDSIGV